MARVEIGDGLAQFRNAGRRSVVRLAGSDRLECRLLDVLRRVEIGLAQREIKYLTPFVFNRFASAPIARVAEGAINPARAARLNGMASLLRFETKLPSRQSSSTHPPVFWFTITLQQTRSCHIHAIYPYFSDSLLNSIARGKLCWPGNLYG